MILSKKQIESITLGYYKAVTDENGKLRFNRMTDRTQKAFSLENENYFKRAWSTAGVRMDFITDSDTFKMRVSDVKAASSRKFFYFDMYINGELYIHTGKNDYSLEDACDLRAYLDGNENRIQIFFPFSVNPAIESVELSDGAKITPVSPDLRAVCYGDSITNGYDARFPSQSYINRMARLLNCEVFNQAIGGAQFNARIVDNPKEFDPDFITVSYGTNDWAHRESKESLKKAAEDFFSAVYVRWRNIPVFVILPVWRGNADEIKPSGGFKECRSIIAKAAGEYKDFYVIDDMDLVPHAAELFSPDILHPNDDGFAVYGKRVGKFISEKLGIKTEE